MFNQISKNYNKRKKRNPPVFSKELVKRVMIKVDSNGNIGLDKDEFY